MTIHVTQEDIDQGIKRHCFHCPVARSAERAFGSTVKVFRHWMIVYDPDGKCRRLRNPMMMSAWIRDFDEGELVGPISFEVEEAGV